MTINFELEMLEDHDRPAPVLSETVKSLIALFEIDEDTYEYLICSTAQEGDEYFACGIREWLPVVKTYNPPYTILRRPKVKPHVWQVGDGLKVDDDNMFILKSYCEKDRVFSSVNLNTLCEMTWTPEYLESNFTPLTKAEVLRLATEQAEARG